MFSAKVLIQKGYYSKENVSMSLYYVSTSFSLSLMKENLWKLYEEIYYHEKEGNIHVCLWVLKDSEKYVWQMKRESEECLSAVVKLPESMKQAEKKERRGRRKNISIMSTEGASGLYSNYCVSKMYSELLWYIYENTVRYVKKKASSLSAFWYSIYLLNVNIL